MDGIDRDLVLTHFMECTGLDDVEKCIEILEKHHWDLSRALDSVLQKQTVFEKPNTSHPTALKPPKKPATTSQNHLRNKSIIARNSKKDDISLDDDDSDDVEIVASVRNPVVVKKPAAAATSTRAATHNTLYFSVEYTDKTERIIMADTDTIHNLRLKIQEKFHISPSNQRFSDWGKVPYTDQTILKDLRLPAESTIHLLRGESSITNGSTRRSPSQGATSRTTKHTTASSHTSNVASEKGLPINVDYQDAKGKQMIVQVHLLPTTNIRQLKLEIEKVLKVPPADQIWADFINAQETDLVKDKLPSVKHNLKLKQKITSPQRAQHTTVRPTMPKSRSYQSEDEIMEVDGSPTDRRQMDFDLTGDSPPHGTVESYPYGISKELLIPEECNDEVFGLENFSRVFHLRYNATGPILYIGSLQKAIQESLFTSVFERRPLLVYLHDDAAIGANVFCTQVLSSEAMIEYLANNFVVWAWDFTSKKNRSKFFESFKHLTSSRSAQAVHEKQLESYPLMITLTRNRSSVEVAQIIEGSSTLDEVVMNLSTVNDDFLQQKETEINEEMERQTRENLKKQQEDEYDLSMKADRAKEEARQAEQKKKNEEEQAKIKLEKQRKQEQIDCKARLPSEPNETEKNLTRFKIRLPDGQGVLLRRFRLNETLQTLFDYLSSEGRFFGEYKLITTYPKRDLTQLNRTNTFEDLKLYPQEQLILEFL